MKSKILRTIILGAPGSGKGTISSRLVRDFRLQHIASGDLLRHHIAAKTKLGMDLDDYLKRGKLVPDPLMVELISSELNQIHRSWLLDGFPRTLLQAESLNKSHIIDIVFNLDVPFDTIRQRLEQRWIHAPSGRVYHLTWNPPKSPGVDDVTGEKLTQRDDDKPATVQKRLELYDQMTRPLLEYYDKLGVLQSFHGTESDVIYPQLHAFVNTFVTNYYKGLNF